MQKYYDATVTAGKYGTLADAINRFGERRGEYYRTHYDRDTQTWTEVEVDSWVSGPLLYLEEKRNGETRKPTLGTQFVTVVLHAGYVPWGFRPEYNRAGGTRTHTGRWMWYLRPVEDIVEGDFYEVAFALKDGSGSYVRDDNDNLLTFEAEEAITLAAEMDGMQVVEVTQ